MGTAFVAVVVSSNLFIIIGLTVVYASRIKKAGPNEALVISGRRFPRINPITGETEITNFRIVVGGRAFIWPLIERVDTLSLELIIVEINIHDACTSEGKRVTIDGVAQVKIGSDEMSIVTAAEHFLSKRQDEIGRMAQDILTSHLQAILGNLTTNEITRDRNALAKQLQEAATQDLSKIGLSIYSFVVKHIRSSQSQRDELA